MSTEADLEHAMRAAFRDAAESVVAQPDPMTRLLARRKRRFTGRTFFASIAAGVAVTTALTLPSVLSTADRGDRADGHSISKWAREQLESPTRGSLAGDQTLLNAVRGRIEKDRHRTLDQVKILFLGDAEGRRFLVYARHNDTLAAMYTSDIAANGSTDTLVDDAVGKRQLGPLVTVPSATGTAMIAFVPSECRFATSFEGVVEATGAVRRNWTDEPGGTWLARGTTRPAERWRITCGAAVRFEAPATRIAEVDDSADVDLVGLGGLAHGPTVHRWTGTVEGFPGKWTVRTTLLSGGGVAAILTDGAVATSTVALRFPGASVASMLDAPQKFTDADGTGRGVMSTAVSADPDVIAIRMPVRIDGETYYSGWTIILTTKPYPWKVGVTASTSSNSEAPMVDGYARLQAAAGPVVVYDVTGEVIGRTHVPFEEGASYYLGEKVVDDF